MYYPKMGLSVLSFLSEAQRLQSWPVYLSLLLFMNCNLSCNCPARSGQCQYEEVTAIYSDNVSVQVFLSLTTGRLLLLEFHTVSQHDIWVCRFLIEYGIQKKRISSHDLRESLLRVFASIDMRKIFYSYLPVRIDSQQNLHDTPCSDESSL